MNRKLPLLLCALAAVCIATHVATAQEVAAQDQAVTTTLTETATEAPAASADIRERTLLSMIKDGGLVMIPLLVCSFVWMVFFFERTISLRKSRVIPAPFVKRLLHQLKEGTLDREQALKLCDENRSIIAAVFTSGLRKSGRPSSEIDQAIDDAGVRATNELRRYLRVFNGIATVGPLLGLLGTVFGMIQCFNEISGADAMGRPELLAGGISQALLTTAAGLAIAIPALISYMFFCGRVDQLIMQIDALGQELVQLISADAAETAPKAKPQRARRQEAA